MKTWTQTWREARQRQIELFPQDPGGGKFIWKDKVYTTAIPSENDSFTYDPDPKDWPDHKFVPVQGIFLKEELSIAQELADMIPAIRAEFLANTPGFDTGDFSANPELITPIFSGAPVGTYLVETIKYIYGQKGHDITPTYMTGKKDIYPTLLGLTDKLGDHCHCCLYTVLMPGASIRRQNAIENNNNKYLRLYLPLINCENNDVFVEVEGIEVNLKDIFGIDSTLLHSEHNMSNKPRVTLMLDVSWEYLGMPQGLPFDGWRKMHLVPFVRGAQPRMYHSVERQA